MRPRRAALRAVAICAAFAVAGVLSEAHAQTSTATGVPNAVQGFSQNRDKPIQIDAASLEMRDKDKAATFSGNVKVVQGDTTMRCKTLVVFYDNNDASGKPAMKSATPGPGGSSQIRRLEAKGGVIVTQKEQTVTGDRGTFDMRANTVTMEGNVLLTKEKNVLRGDKLIVDMTTGVSRVESGGGRVQGVFQSTPGSGSPLGGSSTTTPAPKEKEPASSAPGKPLKLNEFSAPKRNQG
ncbi:MAG: LPS ABC transporter substrate-binding protein LptA [Rhizobiales bacterium]|nr:LPS ABC transporter substrate-binding protein LptA [Hyphomicrobiales bacterium]